MSLYAQDVTCPQPYDPDCCAALQTMINVIFCPLPHHSSPFHAPPPLSASKSSVLMSVMIIHIVVSLIIALGFLGAFIWAIKSNQYDDDYSPSVRILFDDHKPDNQNN